MMMMVMMVMIMMKRFYVCRAAVSAVILMLPQMH